MTPANFNVPAIAFSASLIRGFEKFSAFPYYLSGWAIGYGSSRLADGSAVTTHTPAMTKPEAEALMALVVGQLAAAMELQVTRAIPTCQAGALLSFAYNVGDGGFAGSTLLRLLNAGNPAGVVAAQFLLWNHAAGVPNTGLARRRTVEQRAFLGLPVNPVAFMSMAHPLGELGQPPPIS